MQMVHKQMKMFNLSHTEEIKIKIVLSYLSADLLK